MVELSVLVPMKGTEVLMIFFFFWNWRPFFANMNCFWGKWKGLSGRAGAMIDKSNGIAPEL